MIIDQFGVPILSPGEQEEAKFQARQQVEAHPSECPKCGATFGGADISDAVTNMRRHYATHQRNQ